MAEPKNSARRKSTPALVPQFQEVTVYATFENPWGRDEAGEIAAIQEWRWHPSVDDFGAVAETPNRLARAELTYVVPISNLGQLVGALKEREVGQGRYVERPDHSVKRLNIISHGMPGVIALSGKLTKEGRCYLGNPDKEWNKDRTQRLPILKTQIDDAALDWLDGAKLFEDAEEEEDAKVGKAYRDIIRSKLAIEGAEVWLILCRGASGKGGPVGAGTVLATRLATTFGATVKAFSDEVMYWPLEELPQAALRNPRARIPSRNWTSIGREEGRERGLGYYSADDVSYVTATGEKKRLGWHMEKWVVSFPPTPKK